MTPTPGPFSSRRSDPSRARSGHSICPIDVLERAHPRVDRRAPVERPDGVVLEERRRGPEADERRRPDVAAAAGRQRVVGFLAGDRMADLDRPDRRQLLVGLGREVVPDVVANGVGRQRAAGVDAEQRDRHAQLGREEVVLRGSRSASDDRAASRLLKSSVLVQAQYAFHASGSSVRCAFSRSRPAGRFGQLARVASARSARRRRPCRAAQRSASSSR